MSSSRDNNGFTNRGGPGNGGGFGDRSGGQGGAVFTDHNRSGSPSIGGRGWLDPPGGHKPGGPGYLSMDRHHSRPHFRPYCPPPIYRYPTFCRPRPCVGFGFYVTRSYFPTYYVPYYVAEPVYVAPPIIEQTVVVPPPVMYEQAPAVYGESYSAPGAYDAGGQVTYNTYNNYSGAGAPSTEVPAGVGDTPQEQPAQSQDQAQQSTQQQPPAQPSQQQNSSSGGTPNGEQLYQRMVDGTDKFSKGAYEEAAKLFLDVATQDPANVDAALAYAVARFATGDYAVSAISIRRGIGRLPDIVNSLFAIQDRYGKVGDLDQHMQSLVTFLRDHPDNVDAVLVLGFVQHFTGQRGAAKDTFGQLRRMSKEDAQLADTFLNAKPLPEPTDAPAGGGSRPENQGSSQPTSSSSPEPRTGTQRLNAETPQAASMAVPADNSTSYLNNAPSSYAEVLE